MQGTGVDAVNRFSFNERCFPMVYQPPLFPPPPPPPFYPVPPGCNITFAVGAQGFNQAADVTLIQHLLNGVAQADGGPVWPLVEDGCCGPATIQAILQFTTAHNDPEDTIYPNSALH